MNKNLGAALISRENNFDFLRFAAALLVIYSHAFLMTAHEENEPLNIFSNNRMSLGQLAVVGFFVISGFLITMSYDRAKTVRQYFISRGLRIYPGLIVVILATTVFIGPLLTSLPLPGYFGDFQTYRYLLNAFAVKMSFRLPGVLELNPFPRNVINGSLWTLPNEVFCYIAVAAAGMLVKKKFLIALPLIGVLVLFLLISEEEPLIRNAYYFLTGSLMYIFRSKITLNLYVFLTATLVVIAVLRYSADPIISEVILGPSLGYALMYVSFIKNDHIRHFAKSGDYSYGLYIWAFPVQQLIYYYSGSASALFNFFWSTIVTMILAVLSWHLIEKRALKFKTAIALIQRNT